MLQNDAVSLAASRMPAMLTMTSHAAGRANQRGITRKMLDQLASLADREVPVGRWLTALYLSRETAAWAVSEGWFGGDIERLQGLVAIISHDGAIVTVAHMHGRKGARYRRRIDRFWR